MYNRVVSALRGIGMKIKKEKIPLDVVIPLINVPYYVFTGCCPKMEPATTKNKTPTTTTTGTTTVSMKITIHPIQYKRTIQFHIITHYPAG